MQKSQKINKHAALLLGRSEYSSHIGKDHCQYFYMFFHMSAFILYFGSIYLMFSSLHLREAYTWEIFLLVSVISLFVNLGYKLIFFLMFLLPCNFAITLLLFHENGHSIKKDRFCMQKNPITIWDSTASVLIRK